MKYRNVRNTNLNVSVIGIGTHQFAGEWGKTFTSSEVNRILNKAYDLGINLIDTAPNYGNHLSEKLIGNAISKNRNGWIIATKFGQKIEQNKNINDFSSKEVLKQLEQSLRALKTDYIDIYQFHSGTNDEFINEDLWTALDKQVQAGKIRYLGVSIVNKYVQDNNLYQLENTEMVNIRVIQVVYNRLNRIPEENILPYCKQNGIGVFARVPLSKGFLSGKYKPDHVFGTEDIRSNFGLEGNKKMLETVQKIKYDEVPQNIDMAQWALAWCLKNPAVTAVIPGCKNREQVAFNANAAELI